MRKFINCYNKVCKLLTSGEGLKACCFRLILFLSASFGLVYTSIGYCSGFSAKTGIVGLIFSSLAALLLLFHIKKPSVNKQIKGIYSATLLLVLNMLWLNHGGSESPFLLVFAGVPVLLILIYPQQTSIALSGLVGLNILFLYGIEWFFPEMITSYASENLKWIDHLLVIVCFLSGMFPTLIFFRNRILGEKARANRENQMKSTYLANMSH